MPNPCAQPKKTADPKLLANLLTTLRDLDPETFSELRRKCDHDDHQFSPKAERILKRYGLHGFITEVKTILPDIVNGAT